MYYRLSITEDDLEVLSTVRFIDHYFYFGGSPSNITTLSFLSNLEEIRGAVPYSAGTIQLTAYIVSTKLQDLGLKSFRRALGAPVAIGRSSNLCYVGTLNASYIAPPPSRLISFSNRNHTACSKSCTLARNCASDTICRLHSCYTVNGLHTQKLKSWK